jgi:hypothetical protein
MSLNLVTLFIIIWVLLVTVLGFITLSRYIAYKERVALAQLGFPMDMNSMDISRHSGKRGILWAGVITAMGGLALLLGLSTLGMGVWLLGGLIPLFIGIGMVLIYFMLGNAPEQPKEPDKVPEPIMDAPADVLEAPLNDNHQAS